MYPANLTALDLSLEEIRSVIATANSVSERNGELDGLPNQRSLDIDPRTT